MMIALLLAATILQADVTKLSTDDDYVLPEIDARYVGGGKKSEDYILITAINISSTNVHIAVDPAYYVRIYNTSGIETGKRIRTYATRLPKAREDLNTICKIHRITPITIKRSEIVEILKIPLEKGDVKEDTRSIEIVFSLYHLKNAGCVEQFEKEYRKTITIKES